MNEKKPCNHSWIRTNFGQYVKCEKCGATRENPKIRQAELQESKDMNRSGS